MSFCVMVSYGKDNVDKATVSLTLANAALDSGEAVFIILAGEGVRLAVKGYADDMNNGEPFKPMKKLIHEIVEKGGEINVCTPCMTKRGIQQKDILPTMKLIVGPDVIRILNQTDRSIQL